MSLKQDAKIALMALRCDFVGGVVLTKKGRGLLTPGQWRFINKLKCFFSSTWENRMLDFLEQVDEDEKRRDRLNQLRPQQ